MATIPYWYGIFPCYLKPGIARQTAAVQCISALRSVSRSPNRRYPLENSLFAGNLPGDRYGHHCVASQPVLTFAIVYNLPLTGPKIRPFPRSTCSPGSRYPEVLEETARSLRPTPEKFPIAEIIGGDGFDQDCRPMASMITRRRMVTKVCVGPQPSNKSGRRPGLFSDLAGALCLRFPNPDLCLRSESSVRTDSKLPPPNCLAQTSPDVPQDLMTPFLPRRSDQSRWQRVIFRLKCHLGKRL